MEVETVISNPASRTEKDLAIEAEKQEEVVLQKPYECEGVYFAHQDALSFLQAQEKNSVDLILTDPPYVISRKTGFESCVNGVERFKVSMDFGDWDQ